MKGRSSTGSPPERTADSCASRTSFITPLSAATSPPTRTWQYSLAIRVELNVTISIGFCGAANRSSARSRNGFIATIGTPLLEDLVQGGHHARAVRTGILPDHKDCVRFVEILQQNGALADADALRQAHAGRLVTHVRAIGKVICAEAPHEDLVEKRRFVRSAARRIEVRPVGALQRPKMRADHCESVVPAGRLIVICRAVVAHRLRQASLLFQPVIALPFQFADRLGRKELGRHLSLCEFKGVGFRAVLAELKRASMLRIRPCASLGSRSRPAGSSTAASLSLSAERSARAAPGRRREARPSPRQGFYMARRQGRLPVH